MSADERTPPRFHVPELPLGGELSLPDDGAQHARVVLRLKPGAAVRLFDGAGREHAGLLTAVSTREVRARLDERLPPRAESPLAVTLALAPLKGERLEWALQKAVELGVAALRPVVTTRTDASARPALRGARHERWGRVCIAAAEQCGRAFVPPLLPALTFDALLREPWDGARLLFCERGGVAPLSTLPRAARVLAVVGPEGGWADAEMQAARAAGFTCVGLGPRILRAETAAVVALAALQALWGDLA